MWRADGSWGEQCVDAVDVGEIDGGGGGRGEAGELEELGAGEAGDGGVFGLGEGAEALDDQGLVGLREELGLLLEEVGAELAVGGVLLGEEEVFEVLRAES